MSPTEVGTPTLMTLYDLLHLFALNGPRIERVVVLNWLRRASSRASTENKAAMVRRLERIRSALRDLDIAHHTDQYLADVFIVILRAHDAKERVSALLDARQVTLKKSVFKKAA